MKSLGNTKKNKSMNKLKLVCNFFSLNVAWIPKVPDRHVVYTCTLCTVDSCCDNVTVYIFSNFFL